MKRAHWGSQLGFILATAGSAIGLGNIWRFPYIAGENGGGSFLMLYLLCVFGLGYFMVLSKLSFGRTAKTNLIDGFQIAAEIGNKKASRWWGIVAGWLGFFNSVAVNSIYVVVIGWTLYYLIKSVLMLFSFEPWPMEADSFAHLTNSFEMQLSWAIICIAVTTFVLVKGVKKGIEKISYYLMPLLFILLLIMFIRMMFLPNAIKGIQYFLLPNWNELGFTENGFSLQTFAHLFLKALGQAVYSLSMGMGVIYVYGSYLKNQADIVKSTRLIVLLDTFVAFMAGMIIIPAVFAFNLEIASGPSLSFITLPHVFAQITGGRIFCVLFFLLLFVAALTSLISIYEAVVSLLIDKFKITRLSATLLTAFMNVLGTVIILLSFTNLMPNWKINGTDYFSAIDTLTGSYTMSIMALICTLFMGWKISTLIIRNIQLGHNKELPHFFKRYIRFTLRFMAPLAIGLLIFTAFFDK